MKTNRIIVLLDMDCFYVQVEERDNPEIRGNPAAVVQYNKWKGGGIIAVNYEARALGVKRGMRGDEAREKCPNIHLVTVPVQRGKADLQKYRNAGSEVIDVLCQFSDSVERASIDEAYIDFTEVVNDLTKAQHLVCSEDLSNTWIQGYSYKLETEPEKDTRNDGVTLFVNEISESSVSNVVDDHRLGLAATICERMRRAVFETTGFKCSAGISHNKMLSKLACGLHKPNQQTILPMSSVPVLWADLPLGKIRNLGGKMGESLCSHFGISTMGHLSELSVTQLRSKFDEKTANWLLNLGRGIDSEVVTARLLAKSIGCGKNFVGKESLNTKEKVTSWMNNLTEELSERLCEDQTKNQRTAKTLSVHIRQEDRNNMSRSAPLHSYKATLIAKLALNLIQHTNSAQSKVLLDKWSPAITNISLSAGKFAKLDSNHGNIKDMFQNTAAIIQKFDRVKSRRNINPIKSIFDSQFKNDSSAYKSVSVAGPKISMRKSFDLSLRKSTNSSGSTQRQCLPNISTNEDSTSEKINDDPNEQNTFAEDLCDKETGKDSNGFSKPPTILGENIPSLVIAQKTPSPSPVIFNKLNPSSSVTLKMKKISSTIAAQEVKFPTQLTAQEVTSSQNGKLPSPACAQEVIPHSAEPDLETAQNLSATSKKLKLSSPVLSRKVCKPLNSFFVKYVALKAQVDEKHNWEDVHDTVNPLLTSHTTVESSESKNLPSTSEESSYVDINDIFPDLAAVDEATLALLPIDLQSRVHRAVRVYKESTIEASSSVNDSDRPINESTKTKVCLGQSTVENDSDQLINKSTQSRECKVRAFQENDSDRQWIICERCKKQVLISETIEHSDFHFAVDLRRMQMDELRSSIVSKKDSSPGKKTASKRGRKPSFSIKGNIKIPKIDHFFSKS